MNEYNAMLVKIVSCNNDYDWYYGRVGSSYYVKSIPPYCKDMHQVICGEDLMNNLDAYYISENDFKIINDNIKITEEFEPEFKPVFTVIKQ